jgi:HNH endonuclease
MSYLREHDPRRTRRWRRVRYAALVRDLFRCYWCGGPADTGDHLVPLSMGGDPFDLANVVAACRSCNRGRHHPGAGVPQAAQAPELVTLESVQAQAPHAVAQGNLRTIGGYRVRSSSSGIEGKAGFLERRERARPELATPSPRLAIAGDYTRRRARGAA